MNVRSRVPSTTEMLADEIVVAQTATGGHPIRVPPPPIQKAYPPKIAKAILSITRALAPVKKAGANDFHKYQYPKWEDVLDELGPKMAEAGLIIQMDEIAHGGFQEARMIEVTYEFTIINEDGDVWPDRPHHTAMCKIVDNKGQIDDKAASKAHTQAQKYFLMQLFKIRVREMQEDDHDYDPKKHKVSTRRTVPTSTGKMAPHHLDTAEGETAKAWVARFTALYGASETEAECNAWATANDDVLDRLAEKAPDTYNGLIGIMDAKLATFKPAPAQTRASPISSGLQKTNKDWLRDLGGAFSGCEDLTSLAEQQARLMTPYEGKFSDFAWGQAQELLQEHIDRIGGE